MKPFDINLAKQGHPVCTRDGRKARIITYDKKGIYSIVALVEDGKDEETVMLYNSHGRISKPNGGLDLMMTPVKHEGWVNIYKSDDVQEDLDSFALYQMQQGIFETKDEALGAVKKSIKYSTYIATVKIEWEE